MKPIYNYSPETGVFCGAGYADESPLEPGVYLLPAFSTETPPPSVTTGQHAYFSSGAWDVRTDPATAVDIAPDDIPIDVLIDRRCRDVDAEMSRRNDLPVTFDGAQFDADEPSRTNISGVLLRLLRGNGLPAGWMGWRDYANLMHWSASNASQVLGLLSGLASAIEDRKQALFIAAWAHKASISALTTLEDVQAYSIENGWPS